MAGMASLSGPTTWAQIPLEDDDFEQDFTSLREYETPLDADGVKTVTSYNRNAKGETVKLVKRVKVVKKQTRTNRNVYRREALPKFGLAQDGSEDLPSSIGDEVLIEIPKRINKNFQQEEDDIDYWNDPQFSKDKRELKLKFHSLREQLALNDGSKHDEDGRPSKYQDHTSKTTEKYRAYDSQYKDDCTVRVTNLSDYTEEADLRKLFGKIGPLQRIFLARDKETANSKGFAFITYQRREDADKAIKQLNRHGYDNLLLTVEWAKPSNRDR